MRATINLPDALAEAAKARARAEEPTLDPLPAYGDPRGRFLVDTTDRDALWAALDADGIR
jgi:hypothetical protein